MGSNSIVKNQFFDNFGKIKTYYFLIPFAMLTMYFIEKKVFFVGLFIFLDVMNSMLEKYFNFNSSIIHVMEFGIYIVSYYSGFVFGIILISSYVLTRILTFDFSMNKLKKILFLIPITLVLSTFNSVNFVILAIPLYLTRYILELIIFGINDLNQNLKRIIRILVMIFLFVFISPIFF
ncbi:hypothetical protein HN789_03000 [archaeon]|jgi:hypothetical protein|nr:hypothetical protein [archaeon]MBT4023228.1 hypothetical protein [archaeon]MBT4271898.1 hypothetical protein [archaeon]MBT4460997.1 hypothetical protein [archaeon]MBT4858427.1 hypothetical protein [archaeon]